MRYTLLEMTQRILESMESDEVNSISDTPESLAVAHIIQESYYDIVGQFDPPELIGVFQFDASGDSAKPTLMTIPSNVSNIDWVKYNKGTVASPDYLPLLYVTNEQFFHRTNQLDPSESNQGSMAVSVNGENITFKFHNDRFPNFFTIFDEDQVIFDAYDSDEESTLTESRSLGYGSLVPSFDMNDGFVPDLDPRQFQLLLQDAKSTAFVELKQINNTNAERKARRNAVKAQKDKYTNASDGTSRQRTYSFGRRVGNV